MKGPSGCGLEVPWPRDDDDDDRWPLVSPILAVVVCSAYPAAYPGQGHGHDSPLGGGSAAVCDRRLAQ